MKITNKYLTHNRPYTKRAKTTAVAVHWVGNPGSSATANRNYFQNTDRSVSANYIVGLQGEVICCIPDNEVSWCTNQANNHTVSVETCHPDWTGKFNAATYNSLVELCAQLCNKYKLDPIKGGLIRHFDVTGKICPKWFVPKSKGGSDSNTAVNWEKFKKDVKAKMSGAVSTSGKAQAGSVSSFKPYKVKVVCNELNVRKTPKWTSSDVVTTVHKNEVYTIVGEKVLEGTKFGKLKSGAGYISLGGKYVKKV